MSYLFFLIVLIVLLLFNYRYTRDILSPVVMAYLPWLLALLLLPFSNYSDLDSLVYVYYGIGALVFSVGYYMVSYRYSFNPKQQDTVIYFYNRVSIYGIFFFILLALGVSISFNYNRLANFYYYLVANYDSVSDIGNTGLLGSYLRNLALACILAMLCGIKYVCKDLEYMNKVKKLCFIAVVLAFTRLTRNGILLSLLPFLIAYFMVFDKTNKYKIKMIISAFGLFLAIFVVVAVSKFWYYYANADFWSVTFRQINIYATSAIAAFQYIIDNDMLPEYLGGNTFRFFFAISDSIFGTNLANQLVQNFVDFNESASTNVFTFYHFYASDFGLLYALFAMFVVGILHAILYNRALQGDPFFIYCFSLSTYPLVMQFFQDQYISLLSTWLQFLIVGFFVLRTNLVFKRIK